MRIAIYADRDSKASPSPIDQEMRRSFSDPRVVIERVDRHDLLRESFYRDLGLFILPGIEGETSRYHEHVGPANGLLRAWTHAGGVIFAQCAGACYVARVTRFTPEWAPRKERTQGLLEVFNGTAHGPLPGLGVDGEDPRYYRGLTSANILIEGGDHSQIIPLVYTSGPTFIPDPGQDMRVHARYADIPGQPPAVISFDYGRGLVLLSGPVPQNGATPPTGIAEFATLDALLERIRPFEADRVRFFDSLMQLIRAHVQKAGFRASQPLYKAACQ